MVSKFSDIADWIVSEQIATRVHNIVQKELQLALAETNKSIEELKPAMWHGSNSSLHELCPESYFTLWRWARCVNSYKILSSSYRYTISALVAIGISMLAIFSIFKSNGGGMVQRTLGAITPPWIECEILKRVLMEADIILVWVEKWVEYLEQINTTSVMIPPPLHICSTAMWCKPKWVLKDRLKRRVWQ